MYSVIVAALLAAPPCNGPDVPELIEQAASAARVAVIATAPIPGTSIEGIAFTVAVEEPLWGAPPPRFVAWTPVASCRTVCGAPELILGYRSPTPEERACLKLPAGVELLCGAVPAADGLCAALRSLRSAPDAETLLGLLGDAAPTVRRQAFRQLSASAIGRPDSPSVARLVPHAAAESDPELLDEYLGAFAHFRCREAAPLVANLVLGAEGDAVAAGAERAFPRVADAETVARLAAAYETAHLPVKGRILRALAPVQRPEARRVIQAALTDERTLLPALDALTAAGQPVPRELPRVSDPLRAHELRAFMARRAPAPPSAGAATTPKRDR